MREGQRLGTARHGSQHLRELSPGCQAGKPPVSPRPPGQEAPAGAARGRRSGAAASKRAGGSKWRPPPPHPAPPHAGEKPGSGARLTHRGGDHAWGGGGGGGGGGSGGGARPRLHGIAPRTSPPFPAEAGAAR